MSMVDDMNARLLAARLREAYHADMPGEAVPFDALKPCVCERWQRVADAARVPAEVPAPSRVPFTDAQIERMAKAAQPIVYEGTKWHIIDESAKTALRQGIRAALAAGVLEPCAVPEYEPDDVALRPSDDAWKTPLEFESIIGSPKLSLEWKGARDCFLLSSGNCAAISPAAAARMAAWLSSYAAAHGVPCAPTGHVLRDRLVEAERKVDNQRAELKRLNALVADLRDEVDEDNAAAAQAAGVVSVGDTAKIEWLQAENKRLNDEWAEARAIHNALRDGLAKTAAKSARRAKALKQCHVAIARLRKPHDELYKVAYDKFFDTLKQNRELREQLSDLRAEVDEDNTAAASVNDLLVKVQNLMTECGRKDKGWNHSIKQWEKALGELNESKKSLAAESEWVRIYKQDRDDALAELAERASVPVKVRWDVDCEDAFNSVEGEFPYEIDGVIGICLAQYLMDYLATHAVIDAPAGVPSVEELEELIKQNISALWYERSCHERIATAIRDALLAGVAAKTITLNGKTLTAEDFSESDGSATRLSGVPPTDDQVEALARVLHKSQDAFYCRYGDHATKFDDHTPLWSTMARAAIAHLSKRPEGLPTREELARQAHEIMLQKYPRDYFIPYEDCDSKIKLSRLRFTDAILSALRPWLRDPVGWELVLDYGAIATIIHSAKNMAISDEWVSTASIRILDLCRSRIRPVYECKECANERKRGDEWADDAVKMAGMIKAARAALEGGE